MSDEQQLKVPADAGKGPQGEVRRWLIELAYADKVEKEWREQGRKVVERYRGEGKNADRQSSSETFNILWSNVETMRPALYNSTPEPVVTDRYGDNDPLTRAAVDVLRRALKYTLSSQDFDQVLNLAVQDYLLPGRAGVRVRYVPTFAPAPSSDPLAQQAPVAPAPEVLAFEEVRFEVVDWDGFRRGHAEVWSDLPWIAFELELRYEDLVDLVGKALADVVPMEVRDCEEGEGEDEGVFKTAKVYEIWDRQAHEVLWVAPAYKDAVLKRTPDEYGLEGFFPMPRMMYALETSESLVPAPDFEQYKTLADHLELLTVRMKNLADACVLRGVYPKDIGEMKSLFEATDTMMVASESAERYAEFGGLDKAIAYVPIAPLIEAYQALAAERENTKNAIYELMGASDIMRGATEAIETASAQKLKSRWGSVRLRRRQAEVERFCRDLISLAATLIAEKFQLQTLQMMTGLKFPTLQDKQRAQQQIQFLSSQNPQGAPQQMVDAGKKALVDAQKVVAQPAWEEVMQFLRSDAMRQFKIDVQTDSTIALQQQDDQQEFAKLLDGLGAFAERIMPLVQSGALEFAAAKAMLMGACRRFRLGYEVSDHLDQMVQPPQQDPAKSPEGLKVLAQLASAEKIALGKAQADMAMQQQKMQAEQQAMQTEFQLKQQEQQNALALQQSNDQRQQVLDNNKHALEMQRLAYEDQRAQRAEQNAIAEAKIRALAQIEVARISAGIAKGDEIIEALCGVALPGIGPVDEEPPEPADTQDAMPEAGD